MYSLIVLAVSSFLLALLLTPFVGHYSVRRGWVDTPDARKVYGQACRRLSAT